MSVSVLPNNDITYLKELLLDEHGELRILPYEQLKDIPQTDISIFCVKHGIYALPTQELIDFLQEEITGRSAIEIGAGNGVICKALGITGTDNFMQLRGDIRHLYETKLGQAIVPYGAHVKNFDGVEAVRRFRPDIAIAAWVTHKYNPREHWREGNMYGVQEEKILDRVKKYIFIGNTGVHGKKPICDRSNTTIFADWLLSRSMDREQNCIYIWNMDGDQSGELPYEKTRT